MFVHPMHLLEWADRLLLSKVKEKIFLKTKFKDVYLKKEKNKTFLNEPFDNIFSSILNIPSKFFLQELEDLVVLTLDKLFLSFLNKHSLLILHV